jgi:hypothetical protein
MRIKKNTMNCDQKDCQQFPFITSPFSTLANTLKTKVGDVVGCIFEVECSVGGFLILKQIIHFFLLVFHIDICFISVDVAFLNNSFLNFKSKGNEPKLLADNLTNLVFRALVSSWELCEHNKKKNRYTYLIS